MNPNLAGVISEVENVFFKHQFTSQEVLEALEVMKHSLVSNMVKHVRGE